MPACLRDYISCPAAAAAAGGGGGGGAAAAGGGGAAAAAVGVVMWLCWRVGSNQDNQDKQDTRQQAESPEQVRVRAGSGGGAGGSRRHTGARELGPFHPLLILSNLNAISRREREKAPESKV